jgi:hypothetical protein
MIQQNQILTYRLLHDFQQDCFSCKTLPKTSREPRARFVQIFEFNLGRDLCTVPRARFTSLTEPRAWLIYDTPSEIYPNLGRNWLNVTICWPIFGPSTTMNVIKTKTRTVLTQWCWCLPWWRVLIAGCLLLVSMLNGMRLFVGLLLYVYLFIYFVDCY